MTDDIVKRLREQADDIARADVCGWGNTDTEAADEIERNRDAIAELVALMKELSDEAKHHAYTDDEADEFVSRVREAITRHDTQPTKKGSN